MTGNFPVGEIYAGTSGWAYPSWRPRFYPAKLDSANFLAHYATRLNSVEVNYTFRSQLTRKLLSEWIAATPPHFIFAVKAHQSISHIKRLRGAARQTAKFLKSLEPLRAAGKLGPVLFQLPPNFKCDVARLDVIERATQLGAAGSRFNQQDKISPDVVAWRGEAMLGAGSRACSIQCLECESCAFTVTDGPAEVGVCKREHPPAHR